MVPGAAVYVTSIPICPEIQDTSELNNLHAGVPGGLVGGPRTY